MSWIQRLHETYNSCHSHVGVTVEDCVPLLPTHHIFQNAHIEITLNGQGKFLRASEVSKAQQGTIIPCTEQSGGRSGSDPKCHPLSDKLQYIAGDLDEQVGDLNLRYVAKLNEWHKAYLALLTQWCESEDRHVKAHAVLQYVKRRTTFADLNREGVLNGAQLDDLKKHAGKVVRWKVEIPLDPEPACWKDQSLFKSWGKFQESLTSLSDQDTCYATGEMARVAQSHPKYIRRQGDSAKLISSNDDDGFTFRGRFNSARQACSVSSAVTQKAHNALRWLISRQGQVFLEGKRKEPSLAVVAWSTAGKAVPDPLWDTFELLSGCAIGEVEHPAATAQEVGVRLTKRIAGYKADLGNTERVMVIGLNSASPGRMAIVYYRELHGSDFLERVNAWHSQCSWIQTTERSASGDRTHKGKKGIHTFVGAPAPAQVTRALYGREADDRLRRATAERLLLCIVDGLPIPQEFVTTAVRRASNRFGKTSDEWEQTLGVACAFVRKYSFDYCQEEFTMALDENRTTRDYLYGRLLALAESLEQWALNESEEKRPTTAARLMQRFSDRPFTTWRSIELALSPYKMKLGQASAKRQHLISSVICSFKHDEFMSDKPLTGEYLLGYHCQRMALQRAKQVGNDVETSNS